MPDERYNEYLRSETWQRLRSERLKIDGYKCQRCGRPFDLQVHHLYYPPELGTEDVHRDLITLCDMCHELVEHQKQEFRYNKYAEREAERKRAEEERERRLEELKQMKEDNKRKYEEWKEEMARHKRLVSQFCENVLMDDLSRAGKNGKDYCNKDVVKADLFPFLRENNASLDGVTDVQNFFRNRRYEVILRLINEGNSRQEIQRKTGFSYNMVKKVFDKPHVAEAILKNEKENYEHE